jgi:alpha-N-arabinofuranosidase
VLEYLRQHADYLSLHTYVGNAAGDFGDFMASSMELDRRTRTAEGSSMRRSPDSPSRPTPTPC